MSRPATSPADWRLCGGIRAHLLPPRTPMTGAGLQGASVGGCVLEARVAHGRIAGAPFTRWSASREGERAGLTVDVIEVSAAERAGLADDLQRRRTIQHLGLAPVHRHGETSDGHLYLIADRVQGTTLAERVADRRLSVFDVVRLADQLLDALGALHRAGSGHYRLTPDDVIVLSEPSAPLDVVLVGGGLGPGPAPRDPGAPADDDDPGIAFRAPESFATGAAGPAADLYAVGAVLYFALAGRPPYEGSAARLERCHLAGAVPRLSNAGFSGPIVDFVADLLAKQPADRPADADAARAALAPLKPAAITVASSINRGPPVAAEPEAPAEAPVEEVPVAPPAAPPEPLPVESPSSGGSRWPLIAVVLVVLGAGAWFLLGGDGPADPVVDDPSTDPVATAVVDAAPPPVDAARPDAARPDAAVVDAAVVPDAAPDARPDPTPPKLNTLASKPEGATITLTDGTVLGRTPWSGILPPDVRSLVLSRDGHTSVTVELTADQARKGGWNLSFVLPAAPVARPAMTPAERAAREAARQRLADEQARQAAKRAAWRAKKAEEEAARQRAQEAALAAKKRMEKETADQEKRVKTLGGKETAAPDRGGKRVKVLGQ